MKITAAAFCMLLMGDAVIPIQNNKVVLFDTCKILDARPVITLTNSTPITWRKGIDGGGLSDGYSSITTGTISTMVACFDSPA